METHGIGRPQELPSVNLASPVSWSLYASGLVSAAGIVLLTLMFLVDMRFGKYNDIAIMIQYFLALPAVLVLYRLYRDDSPILSRVGFWAGVTGMIAVIVLQGLLVAGILPFERQVGPVTIALLGILGIWFGITGHLGQVTRKLPHSWLMNILGWTYLGYPIWAFWLGRRLK